MTSVEVYTKPFCSHCFRAKRRLRRKGVSFEEIGAGKDQEAMRAELQARFGASTFPQIVIGGRHVGGADELVKLDKAGELDGLLQACNP